MQEEDKRSIGFSGFSVDVMEALLLDADIDPSQMTDIALQCTCRPEILQFLLQHPRTPEDTRQHVARLLQVPVPVMKEEEPGDSAAERWKEHHRVKTLFQTIQKLKVGEKIQLALRGSREVRSLLLRDSSREVVMTVLENPKMTDSEIEILVKQKTTPEEILRTISKKREWLKNYYIVHGLVTNPKTPVAISLQLLPRLKLQDLSLMEKNKNIPEAVRANIKKALASRAKG